MMEAILTYGVAAIFLYLWWRKGGRKVPEPEVELTPSDPMREASGDEADDEAEFSIFKDTVDSYYAKHQ
jgi:hypothetical protein